MAERRTLAACIRRAQNLWLFSHVLLVAAIAPHLFRVRLSVVHALLSRSFGVKRRDSVYVSRILAYVRIAQRLGRPLVRSGCLTRGTTLFYFLRRAGYDLSLCFGTGNPKGSFAGHCWLELDGVPFLERQDPRQDFSEIFRIPARGRSSTVTRTMRSEVPGALTP